MQALVEMLSSDSDEARRTRRPRCRKLAALGNNKQTIADAGAIPLLVSLLASGFDRRAKVLDVRSCGTSPRRPTTRWRWSRRAPSRSRRCPHRPSRPTRASTRRRSSSALARSQGGNKKAIYKRGGVKKLVKLLSDPKPVTQRHAACALWGLSDGKDGIYDRHIAEAGAIPLLIAMMQNDDAETRGFAAACLLCLCKDRTAHAAILDSGGAELLQQLSYGPATWLRSQVYEMLALLGVPIPDETAAHRSSWGALRAHGAHARDEPAAGDEMGGGQRPAGRPGHPAALLAPLTGTAKMKFHFFSFQIHGTTGYIGTDAFAL